MAHSGWFEEAANITSKYPPTPADARGSAPGNNTFPALLFWCREVLLLAATAAAGSWQKDAEAAARQQAAGSSEQASGQQAGDTFPAGRQQ